MHVEKHACEGLIEELGAASREEEEREDVGGKNVRLVDHSFHFLLGEEELAHKGVAGQVLGPVRVYLL